MIRDPTLFQENNSKPRKARDESPGDIQIPPMQQISSYMNTSFHATEHLLTHPTSTSSYHRRDNTFYEDQAFFDQPPPAYITSAASSLISTQGQHTLTNYDTLPQYQTENSLSTQLQSTGGSVNDPEMNERTPLSLHRTHKRISFRREIVTKVLGIGLVLAIAAAVLSGIFTKRPNLNSDMGGGPRSSDPIHNGGPYCQHVSKSEQTTFEVPKALGLVVIQEIYEGVPHHGREVITAGEVRIRNLPSNSHDEKAHFTVDVKISDPQLSVVKTFNKDDGSLKISTPRFANSGTYDRPCISIEITAWIPKDADIPNVSFDLVTLSVRLPDDDTSINVAGNTVLKTVSGHVHFPKHQTLSANYNPVTTAEIQLQTKFEFYSRRIVVETVSGRIEGAYPLYDLLKLASQSGTIEVDIHPKPILKSAPSSANLDIHTSSGNIKAQSPIKIPQATYPREYITHVGSISGAIQGDFFVGPTAIFKTSSGRIQVLVKPVLPAASGDDEERNEFSTYSISGSTYVTLLDALFILPSSISYTHEEPIESTPANHHSTYAPGITTLSDPSSIQLYKSKLRTFHSTHKSTSGRIEAYYTSSWIGNIQAQTISGRIEVEGKGIKIVERNDGWGFKSIKARKGVEKDEDGGSVGLETVGGTIVLKIPKEFFPLFLKVLRTLSNQSFKMPSLSNSKSNSQSGIYKVINTYSTPSTSNHPSTSPPTYWHPNFTTSITPINCWSHNDEHQPIPLYTALAAGCIAIEADCFVPSHYPSSWLPFSSSPDIPQNDLLVGHETSELQPAKTLSALYLNPILEILTQQNKAAGNPEKKVGVWNENPHLPLHLTIDYKTVCSGHDGIAILDSLLQPLRDAGFLTYYDTATEKLVPGPLTIVGTGDADFDLICEYSRIEIFKDARFFNFLPAQNPSNSLSFETAGGDSEEGM
ncbi:hypothetical protein EYC80_007743 [Monilinia laxa]|uniref:Uncharacterized protein n=1 Tax=Monilinia laxa TaxID=61186 RepID=A0A5N6JWW6_MONLA|nr:hypothetical protein EYC80_007743 [Monilinia laxa]